MKWKNKYLSQPLFWSSLLLFMFCDPVWAQNLDIPKDTTYNTMRVWQQIKNSYPHARPAMDSLGGDLNVARNLVYAHLARTDFGPRDLHLGVIRLNDK